VSKDLLDLELGSMAAFGDFVLWPERHLNLDCEMSIYAIVRLIKLYKIDIAGVYFALSAGLDRCSPGRRPPRFVQAHGIGISQFQSYRRGSFGAGGYTNGPSTAHTMMAIERMVKSDNALSKLQKPSET
jgi:hypothetical protein